MKLSIDNKEYTIKFGYKPTLKSRIISRMVRSNKVDEKDDALESIEDKLLLVPEIILVGLQKNHANEFGYDYDTNEGREEVLNKVFDMVDKYFDNEEADVLALYAELQNEMLKESFLASMFRKAEKIAEAEQTAEEN